MLDDCQPVKGCRVVSSLPAYSRGPGKQSNALVIPNRRCLQSNLSRHLGNRQFGHKEIVDHPFQIKIRTVTDFLQQTLALKLALSCSVMDRATERPELCRQGEVIMQKLKWVLILVLWLSSGNVWAQVGQHRLDAKKTASLDAQQEKHALQILAKLTEKVIVSGADVMPADKYGFAPTDGEFEGVRTFGQMVKHLSATNYILAAAALGEEPPADAGDELGPEAVRTKAEIINYLKGSFAYLDKATEAIGQKAVPVKSSPISPLKGAEVTRLALVVESLAHAFDHYGQMVEYLRMNGVVPPASRP